MAQEKQIISFIYTGKLEDGSIFDSNTKENPLTFTAGNNQIIPGLEKELIKLKIGDKKDILVKAKEAYGEYKKEYVITRSLESLNLKKDDLSKLEIGKTYSLEAPNQKQSNAKLLDMNNNELVLDFNNPFAGKNLIFSVEILDIK